MQALSIAFAALSCTNAGNLRHVGWVSSCKRTDTSHIMQLENQAKFNPELVAQVKTCDDTCRRVGDTQKKAVIVASVLGTCMVLLYSLVSFMLLLRYGSHIFALTVHAILCSTHTFDNVELTHTDCHAVT